MLMHVLLFIVKLLLLGTVVATPFVLLAIPFDWAICFIIAEFFFFPPSQKFFSISGISYFVLLQVSQSIGLVIKVILYKRINKKQPTLSSDDFVAASMYEKWVVILFLLTLLAQLSFQIFNKTFLNFVPINIFIANYVEAFSALIYLWACILFLHTRSQLEKVFFTILLCALVLSVETILVYFVPFIRHAIGNFAFTMTGGFRSFFLEDHLAVVLWVAIAIIISCYFYITYRSHRVWYGFCIALLLVPTLIDFKRSILLGLFFSMFVWFLFVFSKVRQRIMFVVIAGIVCLAFFMCFLFFKNDIYNIYLSHEPVSPPHLQVQPWYEAKPNVPDHGVNSNISTYMAKPYEYFIGRVAKLNSSASFFIRVGQVVRGWQVLMQAFPFGVGPNFTRFYMPLKKFPIWGPKENWIFRTFPFTWEGYMRVGFNGVVTDAQVGYLSFIFSFGVLGLILELLVIVLIIRNLIEFYIKVKYGPVKYFLGLSIACALILYCIYFTFVTIPFVYVLFMVLFRSTFIQKFWASKDSLH